MPIDGDEFLVNTTTLDNQTRPAIAALANGGFVVVWQVDSGDVSRGQCYAQLYDASGNPSGGEISVYNFLFETNPAVAGLADGGFIVTFERSPIPAPEYQGYDIAYVRFDASGNSVNVNLIAFGDGDDNYLLPSIAGTDDGGYIITCQSPDASGQGIYAQLYDSNSFSVAGQFAVNTTTAGDQSKPQVTVLTNEGFVIAWQDSSQSSADTSGNAVLAQLFNSDGTKAGSEILANSTTAGNQSDPTIKALPDGRFLIAWTDSSQSGGDTSGTAVRAQLFNSDGGKSGTEFLVNSTTTADQSSPTVTALSDSRFLIAWTDSSQSGGDTSGTAVRAQLFNSDGSKSGTEFLVNSTITADQFDPAIAALKDDQVAITWTDTSLTDGDTSGSAIRAEAGQLGAPSPPTLPGLVVANASVSDTAPYEDQTITVTFDYQNIGPGAAGASSDIIYLSTSDVFDASAIPLIQVSDSGFAGPGSHEWSARLDLSGRVTPGETYYIYVEADGDNSVNESHENNNISSSCRYSYQRWYRSWTFVHERLRPSKFQRR